MHDNEVLIDVPLIEHLIKKQFPQWAHLPINPVTSAGTDNANFRLGDEMLVRLPRIDWAVNDVHHEQVWLPQLAPQLPLPIPTPIATGKPTEKYPWHWSIYNWIIGENAQLSQISNPVIFAQRLAQFILKMHQFNPSNAPLASRGSALSTRDQQTRSAIQALDGMIDTAAVSHVWEMLLQTPCWEQSPVWIHGDLKPDNLLIQNGALTAVIDFGGTGLGDPAVDLQPAWNLFLDEARRVFRDTMNVDESTWARGKGWALSIALIALPYYKNTNPPLANMSKHVIHQILEDTISD